MCRTGPPLEPQRSVASAAVMSQQKIGEEGGSRTDVRRADADREAN
jgi:hypothetical protein